MKQGGDDLEDDFVFDDTVALSADEDQDGDVVDIAIVSQDVDEMEGHHGVDAVENIERDEAKEERKRKRKEKVKEKKLKLVATDSEGAETRSVTCSSPEELAQNLADMQAKSFSKMTSIELDDMRIPASAVSDTRSWTGPRSLDNLVDFICQALPTLHTRLGQKSKSNGSPTLIFVAGAALRVADVTRVLKDKKLRGEKGGEVAKLFAKHFKLSEHVTYLQRTKIGSAVGTPGRLGQLLENENALATSQLTHIMLDITYHDAKKRSLLDIPETRDQVFKQVLGEPKVLKAIKEGKVQVVLF
ncbi:hypothetical protein PLEOSDRAFT_1033067 [Pleurotus ostreatus PC15]|uniref:Protein cms1 n=1 Tax=Pleurotus ostreatus (strain PC15) TaxID=1137138 RepID=A0A067P055_PLEO1|nr:hypothetical protein PLEOSDRAFT_1033067 [Pleurotus ostreatus PC15]